MKRSRLAVLFAFAITPLVLMAAEATAEDAPEKHRITDSFSGCTGSVSLHVRDDDYLFIGECEPGDSMSLGVAVPIHRLDRPIMAGYEDDANTYSLIYQQTGFIYLEGPTEMPADNSGLRQLEMVSLGNSVDMREPNSCTERTFLDGEMQEKDCSADWPDNELVDAALRLDRYIWTSLAPSRILAAAEEALRRGWYIECEVILLKLMEAHPASDEVEKALRMHEVLRRVGPSAHKYAVNLINPMMVVRWYNAAGLAK